MLPTKYWAEMSWRDFAAADMSQVVAVLPVAAIEQHGPHLPVGVDTFINEGYLARVIARVPSDVPVLFLPVQAIGKSNEHTVHGTDNSCWCLNQKRVSENASSTIFPLS